MISIFTTLKCGEEIMFKINFLIQKTVSKQF